MTADELLETIQAAEPNPEVIAAAQADEAGETATVAPAPRPDPKPSAPPAPKRGPVDDAGVIFDPEIHERDKRGKPKKRKDGRWCRKRGARPKVAGAEPQKVDGLVIPPDPDAETEDPPDVEPGPLAVAVDAYTASAQQAAALFFLPGQFVWGRTPNEAETAGAVQAWTDYFRAYGISQPPPWLGLCIVGASYYGPLIASSATKPKNRERLFAAWIKGKAWLRAAFRRRGQPKAEA